MIKLTLSQALTLEDMKRQYSIRDILEVANKGGFGEVENTYFIHKLSTKELGYALLNKYELV